MVAPPLPVRAEAGKLALDFQTHLPILLNMVPRNFIADAAVRRCEKSA